MGPGKKEPFGEKKLSNFTKFIQGDVAEVCLTMYNPLPSEVKLVNLALLHEV